MGELIGGKGMERHERRKCQREDAEDFQAPSLFLQLNSSAARQKGLSSCVHQKHAFRDNRICSVWMPLKNRILNVTGWKFTVL